MCCACEEQGAAPSSAPAPPEKVVPDPDLVVEPDGACAARVGGQGQVPDRPSDFFVRTCAGCHGDTGEGQAKIPSIRTQMALPQFAAYVRAGVLADARLNRSGRMPSFDQARYPLEVLRRDYAWVNQKTWSPAPGCAPPEEPVWDVPADARVTGLAAWRTPDELGVACADCHGPDPIDLATIAYRPGDILRRAMLHVDSQAAWRVVDYVDALRKDHDLVPVDPFTFRPLQPGGRIIEPASGLPQARDDVERSDYAFGLALAQRAPTLGGAPIRTDAQAASALSELMEINPREFPIGFALNRWTEDAHHGPTHQTFSDWITDLGHAPTPEGVDALRALEDDYLEDPSWARLLPLVDAVGEDSVLVGAQLDGVGEVGRAAQMMRLKRQSVLIMQHLMRAEALGLPMLSGPTPLPDRNPIWNVGNMGRVHSGAEASLDTCPVGSACQGYTQELWEDDVRPGNSISDEFDALREPWFWAGWLVDFSTLRTDSSNSTKSTEYLTENLYNAGYYNHLTFLRFRKNLAATLEGGGWDPSDFGLDAPRLASSRLNYGYFLGYGRGTGRKVPQDPVAKALYQRLLANAFRMMWVGVAAEVRQTRQAIGIVDRADPQNTPSDFGLMGLMASGAPFFDDLHDLPDGSFTLDALPGDGWAPEAKKDLELYQEVQRVLRDPGVCDPTPPRYNQGTYPRWCGEMP